MSDEFEVEVVYALPEEQRLYRVRVRPGSSAMDAVTLSGVLEDYPGLDIGHIGVFGKPVSPVYLLGPGDRVEIYRKLLADPKEARRRLADRNKS